MIATAINPPSIIHKFGPSNKFRWPLVRMSDAVTLHYGKALTETVRRPGPVPVYGTNGRTGWHNRALGNGPTVILGRKGMGNLGVEWCEGPFWVIDTAYYTSFGEGVEPRFFYYFTNYVGLNHLKDGTSNPSLTRDTFSRQIFPLPPIDEQRRIARLLGDLDERIELNRQMSETLEAMARAIFKSWFVDFDPVRAKAEGRQPFGMDAETAALFPDSLQHAGLGQIPRGWRVGKLNEVLSLTRDTVTPSAVRGEEFDHYSIPAFDEGGWPKQESGEQIKSNKFLVPAGAVLLSKLNPRFPRVWMPIVSKTNRSIASTEFLVAVPQKGFSREFVYSLFGSPEFQAGFETLVTGTSGSHQRVKPEFVLAMDTIVPSPQCLDCFSRVAAPFYAKAANGLSESRTLSAIRDALLPKLISGDIRVKTK